MLVDIPNIIAIIYLYVYKYKYTHFMAGVVFRHRDNVQK